MDIQLYEGIKFHIKNLKTPKNISENVRQKIVKTAHNFTRKGEVLYWIKNNEERIVVKESELEMILHNGHASLQAGHFDAQTTYHKLYEHYYWPKMLTSIQAYVQTCNICQRRGKPKRTEPLNPIQVGELFDRWGMDIVGPFTETEQKF